MQTAHADNYSAVVAVTFGSTPIPGNTLLFFAAGHPANITFPDDMTMIYSNQDWNTNEFIAIFRHRVQSGDGTVWNFNPGSTSLLMVGVELSNVGRLYVEGGVCAIPSASTETQHGVPAAAIFANSLAYNVFVNDSRSIDGGTTIGSGWTADWIRGMFGNSGPVGADHGIVVQHTSIASPFAAAPPVPQVNWVGSSTTQRTLNATVTISPAT